MSWTITEIGGIQYRVRFRNSHASDNFAVLANLWTHSPGTYSGDYSDELCKVVLSWATDLGDSEEAVIEEIDAMTSTVALFSDRV